MCATTVTPPLPAPLRRPQSRAGPATMTVWVRLSAMAARTVVKRADACGMTADDYVRALVLRHIEDD